MWPGTCVWGKWVGAMFSVDELDGLHYMIGLRRLALTMGLRLTTAMVSRLE